MKAVVFSATIAMVNLLLIEGIDLKNSNENKTTNSNRRVLFGKSANVLDFPFMVTLRIGDALCAGAIIADEWVMSAAHCVYEQNCPTMKIFPVVWEFGESVEPVECYSHPQYSGNSYPYDISMIKVEGNFLQDGRAKKIPLPPPGTYFPPGTLAAIAGRGKTEDKIYPDQLLWANFRVIDWNVCDRKFEESGGGCKLNSNGCIPERLPRRTICTEGEGSSPGGSCFGDSGGPIIINGYLAGIVSFGITDEENECRIGLPSMHTSVVDFLPWIYSFIAPDMDTSGIEVRPEY